jgi:hypothetical protein
MNEWPTKSQDIKLARLFIEFYAVSNGDTQSIGMFEIQTNITNKSFDIQLSPWVLAMTIHFQKQYGIEKGEWIARKILTLCLTKDEQIH